MNNVGQFLRLMTHDLQNIVGGIDLNLQVLPTLLPPGDPAVDFANRALTASADLISALEDVQFFARAVSRQDDGDPVVLCRCDLSAKVRDTALVLQAMASARKVSLTTNVGDSVCTMGESDSIRRTIKILAGDAIRSAFPGESVEITVTNLPVPTVEISVSVEGVFDDGRTTLSTYLAREILEASSATVLMNSESGRSRVQLLFRPA